MKYRTIVIGSSAGGIDAIEKNIKAFKKRISSSSIDCSAFK
ncbi:MAG: hypothetical protein ACLS28_01080 [Clostridium neonatale]